MTDLGHPYRGKSGTANQVEHEPYVMIYEEKMVHFRDMIPGPIRRTLAILIFIPSLVIGFLLALIFCPLAFIAFGSFDMCVDVEIASPWYNTSHVSRMPVIRGWSCLFFGIKPDELKRLREFRLGLTKC